MTNGFCAQLDCAARSGNIAFIDKCLAASANLDQMTMLSKQTPLHASIQSKQTASIHHLVTKGADIYLRDGTGRNCIEFALHLQNDDVAKLIQHLSLHLFGAAVAAACKFSAYNYAAWHPSLHFKKHHTTFSSAALFKLKSGVAKRSLGRRTRSTVVAWSALSGTLMAQLSVEHEGADHQPVLHHRLHRSLMTVFSRTRIAVRFADAHKNLLA